MKKKLLIILTLFIVLAITIIPVFADELSDKVLDDVLEEETQNNPTYLGNVYDYIFVEHLNDTISVVSSIVILSVYKLISKKQNGSNNAILTTATSILQNINSTNKTQTDVLQSVNTMIDGYNVFGTDITRFNSLVETLKEQIVELKTNNTLNQTMLNTMLDMFYSVFANSATIPQGAKDLLTLKYATCKKIIEETKNENLTEVMSKLQGVMVGDANASDN